MYMQTKISLQDCECFSKQNITFRQIAQKNGCSAGTIEKAFKQFGIKKPTYVRPKKPLISFEQATAYMKDGLTFEQISQKTGYSIQKICRQFRKLGIRKNTKKFTLSVEQAEEYKKQGLTFVEIALKMGCSMVVAQRRFKELGIQKHNIHNFEAIVGKQFGNITIIDFMGYDKIQHTHNYTARCGCGKMMTIRYNNLCRTKSCGCIKQCNEKSALWKGHGEISSRVWTSIKTSAKIRKIEFCISIEYIWDLFLEQKGKCALTGRELILKTPSQCYSQRTASLDRIDNTKGYIIGNVQWIHKDINWMKGKFPLDTFLKVCKDVASYLERK